MRDHSEHRRGVPLWRSNIVLIGFLLIGGYLLFTEHRAHLLSVLPFLLLCLIMHFFMHGGRGHGGGDQK